MEQTEFKLSVVGLVTWKNSILLVRTAYGQELRGKSALPGVYVRKFEEPEEALEKVLQHDVHLQVRVHEIIGITARQRLRAGKTQFICTLFLHATPRDPQAIAAGPEIQDVQWVPFTKALTEISDPARRWLPDVVIDFFEEQMG